MMSCKYLLMVVIRWVERAYVHVQKERLPRYLVGSEPQMQSNLVVEAVYLASTIIVF